MPWKYLNFFLDDDEELAEIGRRYSGGDENMMSGHVKKRLAEVGLGWRAKCLWTPCFMPRINNLV